MVGAALRLEAFEIPQMSIKKQNMQFWRLMTVDEATKDTKLS